MSSKIVVQTLLNHTFDFFGHRIRMKKKKPAKSRLLLVG
jgi:hypothetical protein